jgi:aspartyl-tRNA(Asn)/glutamyl-tRNA(Gln) amidotransferase subunit B
MSKTIKGATGYWEIVIGMEVHAQILSQSKLFSGAATAFGAAPNSQVSFIDAGMPGMLPVINRKCVEQAVRTGLGLKAQINLTSVFDRKNYFYPDLPQGYQISQYKSPIVGEGEVFLDMKDETIRVGIERLHMEQDAGKSLHDQSPDSSFVDLNRSGVALMEIVSKPHMRTSEEAAAFLKKLRAILRYLGTCDGNMDEGSMRADVNVSVCREGGYDRFRADGDFKHLGTRCEIKNVNSYRHIREAIEYEARRQIEIIEDGGRIAQQTRLFDPVKGETRPMRSKEESDDYRYFPDPDLLPLELDPAWIKQIEATLPELPDAKKARLQSQYGLSAYDAGVLIIETDRADLFEAAVVGHDPKLMANTITQSVLTFANASGAEVTAEGVLHITVPMLSEYAQLIEDGVISSKIAKEVFERMAAGEGTPKAIVEAHGLVQMSDTGALETAIDAIIAANPDKAEAVKTRPQAIGWFVGQVMRETGGKANPASVNEILKARLGVE